MNQSTLAMAAAPKASIAGARDGRIPLLKFGWIVVQLALVLLLFRQYQIENSGFLLLSQFAFVGFLIHAHLPLRFRLPFFAILSMAGTALLFGVENFAWMFGIGAVLIGICHLPLPVRIRAFLLLAVGGLLALQRSGVVASPWSEAIWPILGAMFMFRLIIYFHDLRFEKTPETPARAISYFYMLPNACFPLFPVVDYKAFKRNYFDDDAYRIYQIGIDWMVRGVVHLILYRLVYYQMTLAPAEVTTPATFIQFILANLLLYLKVSGLFHLIVGMLYLFGFRLPETHNRYFLSAGFTDYYRRINIYWKDFMQKVFYYPALFRLKKLGPNTSIALAIVWVFVATWALHVYQWYWIRGSSLIVVQDILFWTMVGSMVVVSSLYEMKFGRKRSLGVEQFTWKAVAVRTAKSYTTFWFICLLWSFWSCERVDDWFALWSVLGGGYTLEFLFWPVVTLVVSFVGNIQIVMPHADEKTANRPWILQPHAATLGIIALLIGISVEQVNSNFGATASSTIHSLRHANLSRLDAARLERGYYEGLTDVTRFNSQLWEMYAKRPANWLDNQGAGLKRYVEGFAQMEMIPSFVYETTYGTITTNRFGMRDRDYAEHREPGTFRAAVLGASSVMGWGVSDGATFENRLEERLNREFAGAPFAKYELLNYGVQGYQPPQQLPNYERALALQPNGVIYVATGRELTRSANYLAEVMHKGIDIPYPELRAIVEKAEVTKGMGEVEGQRRLKPYAHEILAFVYGHITGHARDHGIQPIWVFLPQLREGAWQEETPETVALAEQSGFVVIRLDDIFKNEDVTRIRLAEWDDHPNTLGHQLIADRLFERFAAERARVFAAGALAQ